MGGDFLLESATHTTSMPTQTTMIVALTGTIILRSIHSGKPGKLDLVSALLTLPPKGGARVPKNENIPLVIALFLLLMTQMTTMAIMMTVRAATTGTIRLTFDRNAMI